MVKSLLGSCILLLLLLGIPLSAMTVLPSSFDDLVTHADTIVRSEVLSLRCEVRGSGRDRHIVTLVRIRVERCLAGESSGEMELELLGGRVDRETMIVSGQPIFTPGDRDILFLKDNTHAFCPVAGVNYGRFWLVESSTPGAETIARADGQPLVSTDHVHETLGEPGPRTRDFRSTNTRSSALSRDAFEEEIRRRRLELTERVKPR